MARPGPEEGRDASGRFAPANPLARLGGKARQGYARLSVKIVSNGMENVSPGLQIYMRRAERFRRVTCAEYARDVGGGYCGVAVSALVLKAAQALAWSQYFHDMASNGGGDIDLIRKETSLAESAKGFLAMAFELCARQAKSRPTSPEDVSWKRRQALARSSSGTVDAPSDSPPPAPYDESEEVGEKFDESDDESDDDA